MTGLEFIESPPKRPSLVSTNPFDKMHQGRLPASGVCGLI